MTEEDIQEMIIKNNLTEEEQVYLKQILLEMSSEGTSQSLNNLWAADYEEIPVGIREFVTNRDYLGNSCTDAEGNLTIYPYWVDVLDYIFTQDNEVFESVFSGAIGLGKSTIAVVGLCYILYKLLCLKDPAGYYGLQKTRIAIAFFNVNMDQAYGVGYAKMQSYLKASPWFLEHGSLYGRTNPTYYPGKDIDILVGSKMDHFIGRDVFAALLDELNFAPGQDATFEKSAILKLYNTIRRRTESRFMKMGKIPGMLFLVSSKDDEHDFLEQYINKNKGKRHMYLVDEPIWVVKANMGLYSGETFNLAVGNRYNKSRILETEEEVLEVEKAGQRVIQVPVEHREAFELDMTTALADIAGIAILSSSKFMNMDKVLKCYKSYLKNPFKMDEIVLPFDDDTQIKDFLIESQLPKLNRNKPHHIHWDTSKNGDRTGLSMMTAANEKQVRRLVKGQVGTVTDVMPKIVFAIAIKNAPGEEIPFFKIRNFIYYLRQIGFNLATITCDSFQSVDTLQQFKVQGFDAYKLSVDTSRDPYESLKNAVNEERLIMPKIPILEDEFADIEDHGKKLDHSESGHKDVLDTIAANVFKLSQSYAPPVTANTADNFVALNSTVGDGYDFDEEWILPNGTLIINPT